MSTETRRCWWCGDDPEYVRYHDEEWGRPVLDDTRLFEKLCLEGFQSGLSWLTILRKRENFRRAFDGFRIEEVARYGDHDVHRLLNDAGIVRHRGKIEAAISNARVCLELIEDQGSLARFVWGHEPRDRPERLPEVEVRRLTTSPSAQAMAKELKRRGFRFVGPTTAYAFHQAMGLVNDHVAGCEAGDRVEGERKVLLRP